MPYEDELDKAYERFTVKMWGYYNELEEELATVKMERTMLIVLNVVLLGVIFWLS